MKQFCRKPDGDDNILTVILLIHPDNFESNMAIIRLKYPNWLHLKTDRKCFSDNFPRVCHQNMKLFLLPQLQFDFLNDKNLVLCCGGRYQKWNVINHKFIKKTESERYKKRFWNREIGQKWDLVIFDWGFLLTRSMRLNCILQDLDHIWGRGTAGKGVWG